MAFRPMIDNGVLSPSGRVSKRAKAASDERVRRELFGDGLAPPKCRQETEKEHDLRWAKEYREMARRGFRPRAHVKAAEHLESKWGVKCGAAIAESIGCKPDKSIGRRTKP